MVEGNPRGAIVVAGDNETKRTISRHFAPSEEGTLLEYVLDSVWTVADELDVVFSKEPSLQTVESIYPFGARVHSRQKEEHIISTVCSALKTLEAEHCIIVSESVPLLKPNVALSLFESALGYDLAIPRWNDGRLEPLLAVYRKKAFLRLATSQPSTFSKDLYTELRHLADQLYTVKFVSVENELRELDPELDSFLEVKDDESLALARAKASSK